MNSKLFPLRLRIMLEKRCRYDCLLALVLSLRAVLALGLAGVDPLSDRVAAVAALPVGRHRRPRSARTRLGRRDASRAIAQRTVSPFPGLKAARSSVIPLAVRRLVISLVS